MNLLKNLTDIVTAPVKIADALILEPLADAVNEIVDEYCE